MERTILKVYISATSCQPCIRAITLYKQRTTVSQRLQTLLGHTRTFCQWLTTTVVREALLPSPSQGNDQVLLKVITMTAWVQLRASKYKSMSELWICAQFMVVLVAKLKQSVWDDLALHLRRTQTSRNTISLYPLMRVSTATTPALNGATRKKRRLFERYVHAKSWFEHFHQADTQIRLTGESARGHVSCSLHCKLARVLASFNCTNLQRQLDRGNIAQALSDNMLNDLKLNTNHYNTGMTIFYVSFLTCVFLSL